MDTIKILIVDNHPITLLGLRTILKESYPNTIFEIVGEAKNGLEVLDHLGKADNDTDVVILDIEMPEMNGLEVAEKIKTSKKLSMVKILIYTNHNSRVLASEAIARGVDGYILKDSPTNIIPIAVKKVFSGEFYIDSNLKSRPIPKPLKPADLTAIEINVICLIMKQFTDKEIAEILKISVDSVENIKRSIRKKTGAVNIVGIVLYAIEHNLCKSIAQ